MFGILTTENDALVDFTFNYGEFCDMIDTQYRTGIESGDLYFSTDVVQRPEHVAKYLREHIQVSFRNVNTDNVVTFVSKSKLGKDGFGVIIPGIVRFSGRMVEDCRDAMCFDIDGNKVWFTDVDEWEVIQ